MSVQAMQWARGKAPSAVAQLILFGLADRADPHGITYVGQATIAKDCSCGERTVRDNLQRLERHVLIARRRRNTSRGWRTSDWIILAPLHVDREGMEDVDPDEMDEFGTGRYPYHIATLACECDDPEWVVEALRLPAADAVRAEGRLPAGTAARCEPLPADDAEPTGSSRQPNRQMAPSLPAAAAGEQLVKPQSEKDVEPTAADVATAGDQDHHHTETRQRLKATRPQLRRNPVVPGL